MNNDRLAQQIQFIVEIDKLKSVIRRSYLVNGSRRENSGEHSWHLAMMAIVLSEHANVDVDVLRVLKMVLIHDIVEIDAGDTFIYDEVGALDKEEREKKAAERIFGLLPAEQTGELRDLWDEFEAGQTPESKFAKSLDRLMPLLHNYHVKGKSWLAHGIKTDQVLKINAPIRDGSETLAEFALSIINDAVAKGYLRE